MRASFFSLLVVCWLVTGCGTTAPPSPSAVPTLDSSPVATPTFVATATPSPTVTPTPTPTPAPPARTVTSDDGLLTIDVPEGALPIDVDMTAQAQGEDDLPPELLGLDVRSAFYRIEPDGTEFASPVTISRRVDLADLGLEVDEDGLPILALAMRSAGGAWEWLDDQRLTADGSFVVVSGMASHASQVFAFGGTAFTRFSLDDSSPRPIGSSVTLTATLVFPDDAGDPPTLAAEFEPIGESDIVALGLGSGPEGNSLSQQFRCVRGGMSFVGVRYSVLNVGAGSQLFRQLGLGPVSLEVTVAAAVTCQTAAPPSSAPTSTAAPSVIPAPSGLARLIFVVRATYANRRAVVAAADVIATTFSQTTRAVFSALQMGRDPGANGLVFV